MNIASHAIKYHNRGLSNPSHTHTRRTIGLPLYRFIQFYELIPTSLSLLGLNGLQRFVAAKTVKTMQIQIQWSSEFIKV